MLEMLQELFDQVVVLMHLCSLASKTSLTCSVTSLESLLLLNFFTPTLIASFSPAMRASYSTWLFEAFQPNFTNYSMETLFGPSRVTSMPLPLLLEAPSTYNVH